MKLAGYSYGLVKTLSLIEMHSHAFDGFAQ